MKIKELNELARNIVGDGKTPNIFFVSNSDGHVLLISPHFPTAYKYWQELPHNAERTLEDRLWGTIASTEPISEGSKNLVTYDDSQSFVESDAGFGTQVAI
jgi:hypothetical protein